MSSGSGLTLRGSTVSDCVAYSLDATVNGTSCAAPLAGSMRRVWVPGSVDSAMPTIALQLSPSRTTITRWSPSRTVGAGSLDGATRTTAMPPGTSEDAGSASVHAGTSSPIDAAIHGPRVIDL